MYNSILVIDEPAFIFKEKPYLIIITFRRKKVISFICFGFF